MKTCTKCGANKPLSEYYKRSAAKDGHTPWCKPCSYEYGKQWNITRHGITIKEYHELLDQQGGRCAACGRTSSEAWTIDHDHSCCPGNYSCGDCIRGLLCKNCNWALGQVNDDIWRLQALIKYLKVWDHAE